MKKSSVVDMKNNLSEYLAEVSGGGGHVVITKHGKPVAALVSMEDLAAIESGVQAAGLAAAAGKWKGFAEIEKDVSRAHRGRSRHGGRKVSL